MLCKSSAKNKFNDTSSNENKVRSGQPKLLGDRENSDENVFMEQKAYCARDEGRVAAILQYFGIALIH